MEPTPIEVLQSMTKVQLYEYARERGLAIGSGCKEDVIGKIVTAERYFAEHGEYPKRTPFNSYKRTPFNSCNSLRK